MTAAGVADEGKQAGQATDVVGKVHDAQVAVRDVGDFVGQNTRNLAHGQRTQQAVGERYRRSLALTDGKSVDQRRRRIVQDRRARQPGDRRAVARQRTISGA
jgi:hypothetical protein